MTFPFDRRGEQAQSSFLYFLYLPRHTLGLGPLPGCPPQVDSHPTFSSPLALSPIYVSSTCPDLPTCVSVLHVPGWPGFQTQSMCMSPLCRPADRGRGCSPQLTPTRQHCTVCNVLSEARSHLNPCTHTSEVGIILSTVQRKKLRLKEAP